MVIGGSLSVVFYRRRLPVANVTPWMGVRLGMVSGILGGGIFAALLSIGAVVFHAGDAIRAKLMEGMQQAAARNPDPQAQQVMEFFKTPQGIVVLLTICPDRCPAGFRDLLRTGRGHRRSPAAAERASLDFDPGHGFARILTDQHRNERSACDPCKSVAKS